VVRRFFFQKRVDVFAVCSKHLIELDDPHVGCSQCRAEAPGAEAILRGQISEE
jgi:hypothetical protein